MSACLARISVSVDRYKHSYWPCERECGHAGPHFAHPPFWWADEGPGFYRTSLDVSAELFIAL